MNAVTRRSTSAIRPSMFRKGLLLLCLLVGSLIMTTTVHARELPGVIGLECSGVIHAGDDTEQGPDAPDKAALHHHGCHGASSFLIGNADTACLVALSTASYSAALATMLLLREPGPQLRPPIA